MKVYLVSWDAMVKFMFIKEGWEVVTDPNEADLIQFNGGHDVSPELYGEKPHYTTSCSRARDENEQIIFDRFVGKKPMSGICRGGQFLNVMSGGKMWQDIEGHAIYGVHDAVDRDGNIFKVTSTHHQAMRPSRGGVVILNAPGNYIVRHMDGENEVELVIFDSVEAVYYSHTNCLCFQPHPEFGYEECKNLYFKLLKEYIGV